MIYIEAQITGMKSRLSLVLLFVLACTHAQANIDDILNEYFTKSPFSTQSSEDIDKWLATLFVSSTPPTVPNTATVPVIYASGAEEEPCECVPFDRCHITAVEGKINVTNIRVDTDSPCDHLSVCCYKRDLLTESNIVPRNPIKKECGIRNNEGIGLRIDDAHDNEAQFGEFPWMVAIYYEQHTKANELHYKCGGSIIHPQAILTSAHCVISKEKTFKVRAGEWDSETTQEIIPHQDRDVKSVIIHPKYYSGAFYNDIAILILESPLELTRTIGIACLPRQGMEVKQSKCIVTGWGQGDFKQVSRNQAILKKIDLPIVPRNTCQDRLRKTWVGEKFQLHDSFICAGGELGKSTCKGDGGSPLVCLVAGTEDKYYQAGIVSWGAECGDGTPEVYANVALFSDWIDQQLRQNGIEPSDNRL